MSKKKTVSIKKAKENQKKKTAIIISIISAIFVVALILLVVFTVKNNGIKDNVADTGSDPDLTVTNKVEMSINDFGIIKLELYGNEAPITVENFMKLVNSGYYDGKYFHRVMNGFMIQGGALDTTGKSDSSLSNIVGEFSANGKTNRILHEKGVISMARNSISMDSAAGQFFIMDEKNTSLDGQYAAFGKVYEGLDVVEAISTTKVTTNSSGEQASPVNPITIEYAKEINE